MLHKVLLEVAPSCEHGIIPALHDGKGLPNDRSLPLARSSSSPWSIQAQSEPLSSPPQSVRANFVPNNESILVIDDSPTVRKILETCLRREGFKVTCFEDGVAAIQWLTQPSTALPALIFLDINLPKMDGYEVVRFLKAKPALKNTIFIILTRRDGVLDRLKGRLCGVHEYMSKPFTTGIITTTVKSYLGIPSSRF